MKECKPLRPDDAALLKKLLAECPNEEFVHRVVEEFELWRWYRDHAEDIIHASDNIRVPLRFQAPPTVH